MVLPVLPPDRLNIFWQISRYKGVAFLYKVNLYMLCIRDKKKISYFYVLLIVSSTN